MMKIILIFCLIYNFNQIDSVVVTNTTLPAIWNIMLPYLKLYRLQVFRGPKCFDNLGCFNGRELWNPRNRPLSFTPEDPEQINTKFKLFTDADQMEPQLVNSDNITNSKFDPHKKVLFVIHGFYLDNFFGQYQKVAFIKLRQSLFKKGKINYIFVDWGRGSTTWYVQATANTRVVGAQIAEFINGIVNKYHLSASDFHLIGHSLGAHVAAYAGSLVKNLGRITGLDPAKPYFEGVPENFRLDSGDATFVEVIHTNSPRTAHPFGFGTSQIVGNLDFFPNGGNFQPGCSTDMNNAWNTGLEHGIQRAGICNHERSILFWAESISNPKCQMMGFACESYEKFRSGDCFLCGENGENCATIGKTTRNGGNRKYFLLTSSDAPFCVYHYKVSFNLDRLADSIGLGRLEVSLKDEKSAKFSGDSGFVGLSSNANISFLAIGDKVSTIGRFSILWTPKSPTIRNLLIRSVDVIPMNLWDDQLKVSRTKSLGSFQLQPLKEKTFVF